MDKVVHFHMPADDMDRARKFYGDIFGWKMLDTGMENEYTLVHTVATDEKGMLQEYGAINGALYKREKAEESQLIVINVPSIDEYLKKIEASGGKVIYPTSPVGYFGLYAVFSDTEGNIVGLFQDLK